MDQKVDNPNLKTTIVAEWWNKFAQFATAPLFSLMILILFSARF